MNTLFDKYGHCIIPKGTKLYKAGEFTVFDTCMFFGLQKSIATAFQNNSNEVQIWTVKQDIKILFMVLEYTQNSRTKSAIVDIYKGYYPSENGINDLEIKHFDHSKRNKFIEKLKNEKIIGWLSSLDDRVDLEVCLFPHEKELDRLIELVKVISNNDTEFEYLNALEKIEIYPSNTFFKQTKKKLLNSPFSDYEKLIGNSIQDEIKQGLTEKQAKHYLLNLRTKLKV